MSHFSEKVSVIMPVYNCERYIAEAVQSVLEQSYENLELIIVNDGSTDKTEEVISSFRKHERVYVMKHDVNKGKVAAINLGIKESSGDIIALLAADDVLPANSLERRVKHLGDNEVAFCNVWCCDENLNRIRLAYRHSDPTFHWDNYKWDLLLHNIAGGGTIVLRRSLVDKIFPIPEILTFEDWWIVFFSLMYSGQIGYLDEPLVLYRIHGANDNGSLATFSRDVAAKRDFSRHSLFYKELSTRLVQLERPDLQELLPVIDMNEYVKRKVVEGKFVPVKREFLRLYGGLEIIKLNMISFGVSAVPFLLVSWVRRVKKRWEQM